MKKRLISALLIAVMAISLLPSTSLSSTRSPYRCGDVNSDGVTDIHDALEILKYLTGLSDKVNYKATITDALEVLKFLAGLQSTISKADCSCKLCFVTPATTTAKPPTTTPPPATTTAPPVTTAPIPTETPKPPKFAELVDGISNRFCENTLIFTINGDPDGFFGHENGILVEGKDREDWIKEFTEERGRAPRPGPTWEGGEIDPYRPANFNRKGRESEREVFVQMFDSTGRLHISQTAGVRVKGGYSRASSQKSLELYAREEYEDGKNTFLFPFFDDEYSTDGNIMTRYRRIRLRNGGSDRDSGFIRDELSQSLFRQAGHPDTQTHVPAAVFLNNEYYGSAWLKSPRTENHLRRTYGGETDNFEIIEGGDNRLTDQWWFGEQRAVDDINDIFALARRGFTGTAGQTRFEEFCRRVDLDSLVRYYAMQIYINNLDWPNHNIEMWRYFKTDDEVNLHPYLEDERWRFFSHDVEAGWNIHDSNMHNQDALRGILIGNHGWNGNNSSTFLYYLLERDDMKAKFANTFVDLMEGAFSPENVIAVLNELTAKVQNEHNFALRANIFSPHIDGWPTIGSVRDSRNDIRTFANRRPAVIYRSIETNLGFSQDKRMAVTLITGVGGGAMMNSRPVAESTTTVGNYFAGTSVSITALPYPGYVFSHWTVGTVRQDAGETITVSVVSRVTAHFAKCPDAGLTITKVKATGNDYIIISNNTDFELSTAGLFLADGSNLHKFELPDIKVKAGESIRVISQNNTDEEPFDVQASFNVDFGERLRLTDGENTLQLVEVSRMSKDGVQIRQRDGRWKVIEPEKEEPPATHKVSVAVRDPVRWVFHESHPIEITGEGQYKGKVTLPANTNRIISLGVVSLGGHFINEADNWAAAIPAPTEFADLRVKVDDIKINGVSYENTYGTGDLVRGGNDARTGHTYIELWNGWWEPSDRVVGVTRVPISGDGFAFSVGDAISEIEVTFTVLR